MYGYTPIENFLDVINVKKELRMTGDELVEVFDHFPLDQLWTVRLGDIFLSTIYATDPDGLYDLSVRQQGKDYYIPTAAEVEELFDTSIRVEHHLYPFLYLPSLAFPCYNGIIS